MTNLSGADLKNGAAVGSQGEGMDSPSTFPAYPEYKDSRVEWLDTLPAQWEKVALKWVSRIFAGGTPDKTKTHYWENGSIPWLNSGAVNQVLISEPSAFITTEAFNSSSARWIPSGSLVMALAGQGKTKGMVAQLAIRTTCNQSMAAIIPVGNVKPRYLFWWLSNNYQNIRNMAGGDLRDGLNLELIGDIPALMPSEEEQNQIAHFLDHETARIDALIEEQQRLIELLKEKRQAVIYHAVTKGLDPTVPMKDSGVEWLGKVPTHWRFGKIRYFAKIESGHTPSRSKPEYWENCTIPWFSLADVWQIRSGEMIELFQTKELVSELGLANSSARLLPKGTVILSRTASVGYSAIMGCDMATTQDFVNWICGDKLDNKFLLFCFRAMKSEFDRLMVGSTHKTIYMPDIAELVCSVPPLDEQEKIAAHIKISNSKFGSMIEEADRMMKLLSERRSALISAAVTGKIDVRSWQPPANAQSPEVAQETV